jgi:hypothetical protein
MQLQQSGCLSHICPWILSLQLLQPAVARVREQVDGAGNADAGAAGMKKLHQHGQTSQCSWCRDPLLKSIGYIWSYLACITGGLAPI